MDNPTKTKRGFAPNITFGTRGSIDADALRDLAQNDPAVFAATITDMIDKRELRLDQVRDFGQMLNRLMDIKVPAYFRIGGETRAIQTSAFPLMTGGLVVAAMNDAYMAVPTIGQELVTEMESNKKFDYVASILPLDVNEDQVAEGQDFPEVSASEEKFAIGHKRNGRRLSMTQETIEENDVAGFVERVNALGQIAADYEEELTLRRVCDIDGSATSPAAPYVLRPDGAGVALYQTDNNPLSRLPSTGNRITNNALVDETDLETARVRLAAMTDSRGKRISNPVSQMNLLVPDALHSTAWKILGSELVPGTANELNAWGPRGAHRPRLLSSPKLDDLSTTAWYLGTHSKQFKRKYKIRFEYMTLNMDAETYLRSRIAFQARIAWDIEVGAVDYVYVVQNLTATTAP